MGIVKRFKRLVSVMPKSSSMRIEDLILVANYVLLFPKATALEKNAFLWTHHDQHLQNPRSMMRPKLHEQSKALVFRASDVQLLPTEPTCQTIAGVSSIWGLHLEFMEFQLKT
ncbi:hypothetical protein MPSEU_000001000 [Mayamaea pseudoterrestris]|nr:hypothetical protein MPSEU_000001000 [Mayamaea pseudoterrestris]